MPERSLRFLHASDFHLERPLHGTSDVPEPLRELFIDAPYRAAQRVFDVALAEKVDFVVLAGDLVDADASGPRGPLFLCEQFDRLAVQNIPVYWACGQADSPEQWPAVFDLPKNVQRFVLAEAEELRHTRDGIAVARILGQSHARRLKLRAADFTLDVQGLFTLAVAYGDADPAALVGGAVDYWALGSRHDRATLASSPHVAHYPGSPQGRQPSETGVHGTTLVVVDAAGPARLNLVPTDVVRWHTDRLTVAPGMTREQVERMLETRTTELAVANPGVELLVTWIIGGTGPLATALRRGTLAADLLARQRARDGLRATGVWSLAVEAAPSPAPPDEWFEKETMRGEFLRAVRRCQMAAAEREPDDLNVETYLTPSQAESALAAAVRLDDADVRQQVLRRVASLGADLLTVEEG